MQIAFEQEFSTWAVSVVVGNNINISKSSTHYLNDTTGLTFRRYLLPSLLKTSFLVS